jgi:hypothetical protein
MKDVWMDLDVLDAMVRDLEQKLRDFNDARAEAQLELGLPIIVHLLDGIVMMREGSLVEGFRLNSMCHTNVSVGFRERINLCPKNWVIV